MTDHTTTSPPAAPATTDALVERLINAARSYEAARENRTWPAFAEADALDAARADVLARLAAPPPPVPVISDDMIERGAEAFYNMATGEDHGTYWGTADNIDRQWYRDLMTEALTAAFAITTPTTDPATRKDPT